MALSNPVLVGSAAQGNVAHASDTITTTADIPANSLVVLLWAVNANRTISSITGTAGLTFQQDAGQALAAASGGSGWMYSARTSSLIPAGSTVVVNFTTGTIVSAAALVYVTGAASSSWLDVATQNAGTTGSTWDTGATAARANAADVAISFAFAASARTSATDSPATLLTEVSSGGRPLNVSYEQFSSTGTTDFTGTWVGGSATWNAAIATYKAAGGTDATVTAGVGSATADGVAAAPAVAPSGAAGSSAADASAAAPAVTIAAGSGSATASGSAATVLGGDVTIAAGAGSAVADGGPASVVTTVPQPPSTGPTGGRYEPGGDETSIYGASVRIKALPGSAVADGGAATVRVDQPLRFRLPRRKPPVPAPAPEPPPPPRIAVVATAGAAVADGGPVLVKPVSLVDSRELDAVRSELAALRREVQSLRATRQDPEDLALLIAASMR